MKTAIAHFDNGDSITTSINGTEDEIRAYYFGQVFNLGDGSGGDLLARCIKLEILN